MTIQKFLLPLCLLPLVVFAESPVSLDATPKDATAHTISRNQAVKAGLNTASISHENELAKTGLIAASDGLQIRRFGTEMFAWDMTRYQFLMGEAPDTVNPKLWEHAKINMNIGLYRVTENIFQVRGFDLANITFIRGNSGWIVIDPLTAQETSAAALAFINEALDETLAVSAVIYTHSHVDHYAGVLGVHNTNTVIYAPVGFLDAVCDENLLAGVAMFRRSFYMYGTILPSGPKGQVDGGLGKKVAFGTQSLKAPHVTIEQATETVTIDGVEVVFQLTNGTEAPSEMNAYFPSEKALCIAENCTTTLHNLYTLRGAQVRDSEKWVDYLDQTIALFGADAQSIFSTHNWPRFDAEIVPYLQAQRDCYQFIKDQTLRLMSQGHTLDEVGRMLTLPASLSAHFFNGEFYGTVSHNAKAVYQKYLGWYDSNPVNLNKLLPVESAQLTVEYMGGADAILQKAALDFAAGKFEWVAEVTRQVIFADPENTQAKFLCADALEQLGYMSESGPWRNEYLFAASELRHGIQLPDTGVTYSSDVYDALSAKQFAALLAIRLNGERAEGHEIVFAIQCGDILLPLHLRNSILAFLGETPAPPAFTVTLDKTSFYRLVSGARGEIQFTVAPESERATFENFLTLLDTADNRFPIVTP